MDATGLASYSTRAGLQVYDPILMDATMALEERYRKHVVEYVQGASQGFISRRVKEMGWAIIGPSHFFRPYRMM